MVCSDVRSVSKRKAKDRVAQYFLNNLWVLDDDQKGQELVLHESLSYGQPLGDAIDGIPEAP